jgi:hypothetical protein
VFSLSASTSSGTPFSAVESGSASSCSLAAALMGKRELIAGATLTVEVLNMRAFRGRAAP